MGRQQDDERIGGEPALFQRWTRKLGSGQGVSNSWKETKAADPIPAFLTKSLLFIFCLHRNVRSDGLSVDNQNFRVGCLIRFAGIYTKTPPCGLISSSRILREPEVARQWAGEAGLGHRSR